MTSLVFDGSSSGAPCIFDQSKLFLPPPPPYNLSLVPDSSLVSPAEIPHNDELQTAQVFRLSSIIHPSPVPPPGSCLRSPPGFVCGPLPAAPGDLVKCVPSMDHSDLNQLSARVLPLTVSSINKELENPQRSDPRFELFPDSFPAALSRCCHGNLSKPTDIKPLLCNSSPAVSARLIPNPKMHQVDPMKLGFRSDPSQLAQLKLLNKQHAVIKLKNLPHCRTRDAIWNSESLRTGLNKSNHQLGPITARNMHFSGFL